MENTPDTPIELSDAEKKQLVRERNDELRQTFHGGKSVMTQGIANLPVQTRMAIIYQVQTFTDFNPDNDPYGEHDFGSVEQDSIKAFWKIDYYDESYQFLSEEPWDEDKTNRVLTIMLAEEY